MLTGYFDEAAKERDHGPAFILGGWVASDESWACVATAWNAVLAKYGMAAFHHTDAMALAEPYDVLTEGSRDAMLSDLIGVVETHELDGYFVHLHHDSFRRIFEHVKLTRKQGLLLCNRPYYTSFHALVQCVLQDRNDRKLSGPVNFIFDGKDREIAESIKMLDEDVRPDLAPEQRAMLGTITTSNDIAAVGLQLADLLVSRQNWDFKAKATGDVMKRLCTARRVAESALGPKDMLPYTVLKELVEKFPELKRP